LRLGRPARITRIAKVGAILVLACGVLASAQPVPAGLTIHPVSIQLVADATAAALTVHNHRDSDLRFQIRAFEWSQQQGSDQLTPSDALLVSPPLGVAKAGTDQTVRMLLRRPAQGKEATYRILFDEIPPPPRPGTIAIALRLSIPVFVEPPSQILVPPHLVWSVESDGRDTFLVAINDGGSHQTVRDITLASSGGQILRVENAGPYVLAGSTRRWRILVPRPLPSTGETLHLTAHTDTGSVDQTVAVRNVRS
jgi:fimbrial chaperone protein